jgi:hypothetical protein
MEVGGSNLLAGLQHCWAWLSCSGVRQLSVPVTSMVSSSVHMYVDHLFERDGAHLSIRLKQLWCSKRSLICC